ARERGPLLFHPIDEIVDQRRDIPAACGQALLGRQAVDGAFQHEDGVHLANGAKCNQACAWPSGSLAFPRPERWTQFPRTVAHSADLILPWPSRMSTPLRPL